MPNDREDDRSRGGRPPETPAPRLRPHGPMRTMGDAEARRAQPPPARQGQPEPTPAPAQLSEQDRQAERRRTEGRRLLAGGLEVLRGEHEAKLRRRREAFDRQHRDEIQALAADRRAIQDRRADGTLRARWNRLSGRAAQDDDRLQQLDQQQAQLDARRDEYVRPLAEEQQRELAEHEEGIRHALENLEEEIQRDVYGRGQDHDQQHDRSGHGHDVGDDSGRQR